MSRTRLAVALCLFLGGCGVGSNYRPIPMTTADVSSAIRVSSPDSEVAAVARKEIVVVHPEWDSATKEAVLRGEAVAGMSRQQVFASWGHKLNIRQMGGGGFFNGLPRERWLYDQAPLLVIAYFSEEEFTTARAFDRDGTPVEIARGVHGMLLPPVRDAKVPYGDPRLLHLAQRVDPNWSK